MTRVYAVDGRGESSPSSDRHRTERLLDSRQPLRCYEALWQLRQSSAAQEKSQSGRRTRLEARHAPDYSTG